MKKLSSFLRLCLFIVASVVMFTYLKPKDNLDELMALPTIYRTVRDIKTGEESVSECSAQFEVGDTILAPRKIVIVK